MPALAARGARRSGGAVPSPASPGTATAATSQAQTPVHDAHPDKDAYLTECSGGRLGSQMGDVAALVHERS